MKQLLFSAILLLFSVSLFAQATSVGELRVATNATTFGVSIPVGTKIYNYPDGTGDTNDGKYYVCVTATLSGQSIATQSANFVLLNPAEQALSSLAGVINLSNNATGGTASTLTLSGTGITVTDPGAGTITLTADQELTYSQKADGLTNSIAIENANTITLESVTASKAGLMTSTQFTKLAAITDAAPIGAYYVQYEEVAPPVLPATTPLVEYDLTKTVKNGAGITPIEHILVMLNGFPLKPTTQFTLNATFDKVTIVAATTPLLTYDKLSFAYTY